MNQISMQEGISKSLLTFLGVAAVSNITSAQINNLFPSPRFQQCNATYEIEPSTGQEIIKVISSGFDMDPQSAYAGIFTQSRASTGNVYRNNRLSPTQATIPLTNIKNSLAIGQTMWACLDINTFMSFGDIEIYFEVTKDANGNLIVGNMYNIDGSLSNINLLSNLPIFSTTVTDANCNINGKASIIVGNVDPNDIPLNPDDFTIGDSIIFADMSRNPNQYYHGICRDTNPLKFEIDGLSPGNYNFKALLPSGYQGVLGSTTIGFQGSPNISTVPGSSSQVSLPNGTTANLTTPQFNNIAEVDSVIVRFLGQEYIWTRGDASPTIVPISGSTGQVSLGWNSNSRFSVSGVPRGVNDETATIEVISNCNTISTTETIPAAIISGIDNVDNAPLTVYPNPTSDVLHLKGIENLDVESIKICNAIGNIVYEQDGDGLGGILSQYGLGTALLPNGIYIGTVQTKEGQEKIFKFVVAK